MWCSLIGFMGVGKTTTARELAAKAVLRAVDLDALIVEREGRGVPEIFAAGGEAAFRAAESAALASLDPDDDLVLACGGGIVETPANVDLLRGRGVVLWLDLPWESLRARLERDDPAARPLAASLGWDGLRALERSRRPRYAAAAHFRLRADQDDAEVLARRAAACRLNWSRLRGEEAP